MDWMYSFHEPIPERVPEVPSRNPILFIHARPILAHSIIRHGMGWSAMNKSQDLMMLRCLRYLVPFIWLTGSGVGPGLLGQIVWIATQSVSRSCGLVLHASIILAEKFYLARPNLTRRILCICSVSPRRAKSTCLSALWARGAELMVVGWSQRGLSKRQTR
jgi:hypothetical protein